MLTRILSLLVLLVATSGLTGCCCMSACGTSSACYPPMGPPPAGPCGCNACTPAACGPMVAPVAYGGACGCNQGGGYYGGAPGGCGYGYGGTGCCLFDLFCCIEQWKCDVLGLCHFGVRPRHYGGACGGGCGGCNQCAAPSPCGGPIYSPVTPGFAPGGGCGPGGCGVPGGYPAMLSAPAGGAYPAPMMQPMPGSAGQVPGGVYPGATLSVPSTHYPTVAPGTGQVIVPPAQ